jgi:hypothetical protein
MDLYKTYTTDGFEIGITTTTLYMYVNGDGSLKEVGSVLLTNNK